jgi:uncharacterized LabA/DUF88 family protein
MSLGLKVGVYVDAENIKYNGGYQMRYDVLRRFASRNGDTLLRLNTYLAFDRERAKEDPEYATKAYHYQQTMRDFGWKVIIKDVKRYQDVEGNITTKANADLDLAIDALLQAENLDKVILLSGDGDFVKLVTALQNRGCRVELITFNNTSRELMRQVDASYSGFIIPDLVPISYEPRNDWGAVGSCVRGVCNKWIADKGYGFLNVLSTVTGNMWIPNSRENDSPWLSVFCHINELADEVSPEDLANRDYVVEFYIEESDQKEKGLIAKNVRPAQIYSR